MYNNDLYGDEGDVLAFVGDRSRGNKINEQPNAALQNQPFNSPKIQQQKSAAERRRIQRLQAGGVTVSNTTLSPKARPGSARRPPGGGAFNQQAMAGAAATGEQATAAARANQQPTDSAAAPPVPMPAANPAPKNEAATDIVVKTSRWAFDLCVRNHWSSSNSSCCSQT